MRGAILRGMVDDGTPRPGALLAGRYRLGRELGRGRTGSVFQARDATTGDRLALKLLHTRVAGVDEEVRRFAREFEATRRIEHENVVRAHAYGQEPDGTHWIAMELLDGRRLADQLANGPLDADHAVRIAMEVARALAAAHAHGVVHRDVEPSNVMLARVKGRDVAKVLDFGVARFQLAGGDEAVTGIGVRLGTAEYMSPEYVETGVVDARCDLYALGVLLYAMLTGSAPFVGPALKVMQEHVTATPAAPSSRCPGLPIWLDELVVQLLEKDPAARPQTAHEVAELLERNLPGLDQEASQERRALASFASLPPEDSTGSLSVGHRGETHLPVYPDPKPLPKVPILVTVGLFGFAFVGVSGVLILLGLLVLL